jgi:glucose-6-phosphate-specific signal transduction histidine kinase
VIEDDGTGIHAVANPIRPSFGMAGMQERISALGGQMKVISRKGEGTKISVTVPLSALPAEAELSGKALGGRALRDTGS